MPGLLMTVVVIRLIKEIRSHGSKGICSTTQRHIQFLKLLGGSPYPRSIPTSNANTPVEFRTFSLETTYGLYFVASRALLEEAKKLTSTKFTVTAHSNESWYKLCIKPF